MQQKKANPIKKTKFSFSYPVMITDSKQDYILQADTINYIIDKFPEWFSAIYEKINDFDWWEVVLIKDENWNNRKIRIKKDKEVVNICDTNWKELYGVPF